MTATAATPEHAELVASMTGAMVREVEPFEGSDRLRPDGRPRPELRAALRAISNGRNVVTCVVALMAPVAVLGAVAALGSWWAIIAAFPLMGSLQGRTTCVSPRWA